LTQALADAKQLVLGLGDALFCALLRTLFGTGLALLFASLALFFTRFALLCAGFPLLTTGLEIRILRLEELVA
jgi:hypothetical protein